MQLHNDMRWFDRARDMDAVKRIWREVGWVEDRDDELAMEDMFSIGTTLTGLVNGQAECAVHTTPGTMRLDQTDLDLCAVTAVTTSRLGRKRGFAKRLTATQLAAAAERGAQMAALGMFEQGFYDLVGFGTGSYHDEFTFDPATLLVDRSPRTPVRLSEEDWRDMSSAMVNRLMTHGGCVLEPPEVVASETQWSVNGFGLGYRDDAGTLTHFIWCQTKEPEHGPLEIVMLAYRDTDQLIELLALIKSLGDQVRSVTMMEPPHLSLQDWLDKPFRNRGVTRGSTHQGKHTSCSWFQLRVLDLHSVVPALAVAEPVTFRLDVTDPAADVLGGAWSGCAGSYTVTLGERSEIVAEQSAALPVLSGSINAVSRLLFGVRPASALALRADLDGPAELLQALDHAIRLPPVRPGWDF